MSKVTLNHKLKCLGCACGVASDHWVTRHNLTDRRSARIQSFGSDLFGWSEGKRK